MKRRVLSMLLVFAMVLGWLPVSANAAEPAQSGGVYQIGTAADLLWFAQQVNSGKTTIKAALTTDIDLSNTASWPGIGTSAKPFSGSFDGKNHTVTFRDAPWGLFGYVMGSSGSVVTIQNVRTAGTIKHSGIAHNAGYAHFTNCVNMATINASDSYVAGIVGNVSGKTVSGILKTDVVLTNCGNEASISGCQKVGGLIGYSQSNTRITDCYNTGNISGLGDVGGIAGYFQQSDGTCTIKNSYNTGRVTGDANVGGIVGCMMNNVTITNCYNSGGTTYAIAGSRYNSTSRFVNCYYLGTASAKCSPDYTETIHANDTTAEIATRATAKSAAEMASANFAGLLGSAFAQSCPTPVLTWQTPVNHTGTSSCENCLLGSTEKEVYEVTFQQSGGFTLTGASKATQGSSYSFTISISDGYEKATGFAVKVNGKTVTPASNGKYTVTNVQGPLSVTVLKVQVIPGNHSIQLPGTGNGYRVTGNTAVKRDENYSFKITFVNGFKAGSNFKVVAQEILSETDLKNGVVPAELTLSGSNGTYTIPKVQKNYRILISGVEVVSKVAPVKVTFTVTEGYNNFHVSPQDLTMLNMELEVPYFDLSLYGLEKYYYNPYCYVDENGKIKSRQEKGNAETAYDNITYMHALIVATEIYYLGYDQKDVGKGKNLTAFKDAVSWSQDAGSSFMDFWDHGSNMNYYLNYAYPLAYKGWGSTSDQVTIKDGDILSLHLITGQGSGSNFGFFTVNDTNSKYNPGTDTVDTVTVYQGQKVKLTYFWTATSGSYATNYTLQKNKQLYWADADYGFDDNVSKWSTTGFGGNTLKTDSNGVVSINTADLEPGTYYIGALGGFTEGGGTDDAGFVSAGSETGPAFVQLVVKDADGMLGDVNGDQKISALDSALLMRYVAKLVDTDFNESVADVNGDGKISSLDAALIMRYVAKLINKFPAE